MWLVKSLYESVAMFWEVLWALVFGFAISGALQVFVPKESMERAFGKTNFRSVSLATIYGAASSSCSYAAAAAGSTAFRKGAAFVPAIAFMFASTNIVFELGAVLWVVMGWRFVLAEMLGALVLIGTMWLIMRFTLSPALERSARTHVDSEGEGMGHASEEAEGVGTLGKLGKAANWGKVGNAFQMDWMMMWRELMIGFVIAGLITVLVPNAFWNGLFLTGRHDLLATLTNALVGPLVAVMSFVCSIGNVPLASVLWSGGISFGGVISFLYADLIILPLIILYGRYYGWKMAAYLTGVMYVSMVLSGLLIDAVFTWRGLVPQGPRSPSPMAHAGFDWNYTTWLDLGAILLFLWLVVMAKRYPSQHQGHSCH